MLLDTLQSLDTDLLNAVRSAVDPNSAWQTALVRTFSDIEVVAFAAFLVGYWLVARFLRNDDVEMKKDALALLYAVLFAFALYWILNFGLPARPRPESVSAIRPLIDHLPDNSFPSGHGIFAGASFAAAWIMLRRRTFALTFLALGVPMLAARVAA